MAERLHTHPKLEEKLGLDSEHVIIDRETFERLCHLEGSKWFVAADHPILTRPDWAFLSYEEATAFAAGLPSLGFKNVTVGLTA